jgi:vancomycin resistance protein YoaR
MLKEILWSTAPTPFKNFISNFGKIKFFVLPLLVVLILLISTHLYFLNKIYPGVSIASIQVGGLSKEEATKKISSTQFPEKIILAGENNQFFDITSDQIELLYDIEKTVDGAYMIGHKGDILGNVKDILNLIAEKQNLPYVYQARSEELDSYLETLNQQISIPAVDPEITIQNKIIFVSTGKNGQAVDNLQLKKQIFNTLAYAKKDPIHIPVTKLTSQISNEEAQSIKEKAQNIVGKKISLTFEEQTFIYKDTDLLAILQPIQPNLSPNNNKLQKLVQDIAGTINRAPQDAKLNFENGQVKEFQPAKDGIEVKNDELASTLFETIDRLETTQEKEATISIPVSATKPDVSTSEVNNLGVKELIGRGESYYKGSISSRIHNLSLATSRLNGTLIKPGEEFSFNKGIGEVSQLTGYQQAYVIKEGRTILDDGGGVCQVSTTFFRAALNTGLPVLERHQHSYRVSYYEQGTKLGIDAAIYQPGVDLRIKNDTPGHILILAKNDPKNYHLTFEFYGTSDGRITEISNVRTWDPVPAPPDLYQDDPTLPVGQVKQLEHSIPGIKAAFDYKVTKNGEVLQSKTFTSNYRAWQAVYMRGTLGQ